MSNRSESKRLYYRAERPILVSEVEIECGDPFIEITNEMSNALDRRGHLFLIRDGKLFEKSKLPDSMKRVAFVSTYKTACGLATYTQYLVDELKPLVADVRVFAEDGGEHDAEAISCWKRGGETTRLVTAIDQFNPDVIFLQHEYGLFPNHGLFNALMSQLSKWRTVVTLHTVLEHDVQDSQASLDYLSRVLSEFACPEIIVHSKRAVGTLQARGYSGPIHHIPHGCPPPDLSPALPATKYGMFTPHSIFQYGFGGHHKGWEIAIDVVDELKEKYPDIFYLGVFSLSPFASSNDIHYHECLVDIIKNRGLEKHIAIQRGFQSKEMLRNLIRCTRVALYPYQRPNPSWCSWGASGAVQLPISMGMPVVLSDFPCFMEFESFYPICKTAKEMAQAINKIFSEPTYEDQLRASSRTLAESRSWHNTAMSYIAL